MSRRPEPEIRVLEDSRHLRACESLQQTVWSIADRDVVPVSQLRAALHAGGLVAGAFEADALVGFVYGFPARDEARATDWGLHSHMLGVAPQARGRGIGRSLKWFQRTWCLERGYRWVSWTFDPLQAGNANLNLEHLGALGVAYYRDFYGELGGELAGEVATDRLLAWWPLEAARVQARAAGGDPRPARCVRAPGGQKGFAASITEADAGELPVALAAQGDEPGERNPDLAAPAVTIAAPPSARSLFTHEPDRARRWREAHRAAFGAYLERGWVASRFLRGSYVMERNPR